ncbi:MAG: hypothetical protein ACE10C_01170, partial [Candidatus Binatia bacterium]
SLFEGDRKADRLSRCRACAAPLRGGHVHHAILEWCRPPSHRRWPLGSHVLIVTIARPRLRAQVKVMQIQYQQLQGLTARLAKLEVQASAVPVSLH